MAFCKSSDYMVYSSLLLFSEGVVIWGSNIVPIWILGCHGKFTFWFNAIVNNNMELCANSQDEGQTNVPNTLNLGQDAFFPVKSHNSWDPSCTASIHTFNYIFMLYVVWTSWLMDKPHRKILWPGWRWFLWRGRFQTPVKPAEYFQVLPNIWVQTLTHDMDEWCRVGENPPKASSSSKTWAAILAWLIPSWIYQLGLAHGCWSCPQSNAALEGSLSPKLREDLWCLKKKLAIIKDTSQGIHLFALLVPEVSLFQHTYFLNFLVNI